MTALHINHPRERALRALGITVGCLLASSSINLFLIPNQLLSGGFSGIAILVYFFTGLPIGAQILVYNVPLFVMAYKTLGRAYIADIIFGTVMFSLCIDATHWLTAHAPVSDVMLAAVYGGVFNGLGFGLIFRMNGSSGGLDIVAAVIKKYYSISVGEVLFGINCVIMCVSAFLFGVAPAMYTLISMFMSATLTNRVVTGLHSRKAVLIISRQSTAVAEAVISELRRGVTYLHGEGAFLHQQTQVLFVVVNLTQVAKLKMIVEAYDPSAFMIVLDANEVTGRGFTIPGVQLDAMLEERARQLRPRS